MTDIETIKGDLRKLRKVTYAIEALMKMRETHEKRLVYLSGLPPSKETVEEIEKIEAVLKGLNIEDYIGRATTLEERYVSAIDKLDPLDRQRNTARRRFSSAKRRFGKRNKQNKENVGK